MNMKFLGQVFEKDNTLITPFIFVKIQLILMIRGIGSSEMRKNLYFGHFINL